METKRCPCCTREMEGSVCPHCGFPVQNYNDSHQLPVGTVLRGRYQVGKVLGQGGFGITYLGWDLLMETVIAIKEFYPSNTVNRNNSFSLQVQCNTSHMAPHYQASLERFLREAKALVKFREIPEIVDILDFIEENNTAYIIMEFVKGVDLAKYIRSRGGRLSADETFRILRPVMQALATVHKKGIVHRDISPDNIILDPLGGAKLLDFGAVRVVENPDADKNLTKSTEAILKHGFAPIEQYNSRGSLGPWTDEYAMCSTIWYCLTGTIPEDPSVRISEGLDPDWSSIAGLTPAQQAALAKGMSVRAKDRYPDMDSLIRALFDEPIPSQMPKATPAPQPAAVPPRREPQPEMPKAPVAKKKNKLLPVILSVAVLAVAAALLLVFSGLSGKSPAPAPATEAAPAEPAPTHVAMPQANLHKVAIITDGSDVTDMSYNQMCWEGITWWCESYNVECAYYVPSTYLDTDATIAAAETAIAGGADVLVLPGYSFGGALIYLMEAYPDVKFLAVDMAAGDLTTDYITYHEPTPNTATVVFSVEEAGYFAGYAAVMEGFTKLGFLGGMNVPEINRYGSGFIQGADAAATQMGVVIEIRCEYANQFYGDSNLTQRLSGWYQSGTEVVFTCGGGIYTSALEAAAESGGYVIGVDLDLNQLSSQFFASATKNLTLATYTLLDAANSDAWALFSGKTTTLSQTQGDFTGISINPSWEVRNYTAEVNRNLIEKIATGALVIDSTPEFYRDTSSANLILP